MQVPGALLQIFSGPHILSETHSQALDLPSLRQHDRLCPHPAGARRLEAEERGLAMAQHNGPALSNPQC